MNDYNLSKQELHDLQALQRQLSEKLQADRVKAIVLLGTGWEPSQVAVALMMGRSTLRRYFKDYRKGGVDRLFKTHYLSHQRGYLRFEQERELDTYLQENLQLTAKSVVAAYVEKRWSIYYSESGMTDLLHRLGYVYKKLKKSSFLAIRSCKNNNLNKMLSCLRMQSPTTQSGHGL